MVKRALIPIERIKKPKRVELVRGKDNELMIDGVKYYIDRVKIKKVDGIEHEDKIIFKQLDKKEYRNLVKTIVKKIAKQLTKEELLEHMISGLDMNILRRLVRRIEKGKPIKKQRGCLGFKIGDAYLELVG